MIGIPTTSPAIAPKLSVKIPRNASRFSRRLVTFMPQLLDPADDGDPHDEDADDRYRPDGNQAGAAQRDSRRQRHRPDRWGREMDVLLVFHDLVAAVRGWRPRDVHSVIRVHRHAPLRLE